ncbi:hypothetical protein RYX36_024415 [Vicia faba]
MMFGWRKGCRASITENPEDVSQWIDDVEEQGRLESEGVCCSNGGGGKQQDRGEGKCYEGNEFEGEREKEFISEFTIVSASAFLG